MIEVHSLLKPVTKHADGCGVTYTESETFLEVEEALRADDPSRDDRVWTRADRKLADWRKAQALAVGMLKEESKDLRLLNVLARIEAELDGLSGLAWVAELAAGLVKTFGADLHPRTRAGDVRPRLLALANLDKKLAECVEALVRASGAAVVGGDGATSTLLSLRIDELQRTAVDCWVLQDHPFALTKCKEALAPIFALHAVPTADGPGSARGDGWAPSSSMLAAAPTGRPSDSPRLPEALTNMSNATFDRETAIQQLREVALLFRRIEPHSPVAPLVEQAIRWANQPLEQWLAEVIPDADVLSRLRERLGIPAPAVPSEE
jgi:type VI secretion system protein ImpA